VIYTTRAMTSPMTVRELAEALGGRVTGDPNLVITGVSDLANAGPGDLAFVESRKFAKSLQTTRASAVLATDSQDVPCSISAIRVERPALAMTRAIDLLVPEERFYTTVSPLAALGRDVELADGVGLGPYVTLGDGVRVGAGTEIHPHTSVGARCVIGAGCRIYAGVRLYHDTVIGDRVVLHSGAVIGADGFGFVPEPIAGSTDPDEPTRHRKRRQLGRVVIEDDVEVGANSTIDRASLSETRIARGTKIDNLVMIGHNCTVGRHCILVGQAGVSGSTTIGDYVVVAGQAGLTGHLTIGRGAVVGAQAGVTNDVPPGQAVLGSPAVDARRAKKALALLDSLPEFKKKLASHEDRLAAIEGEPGADTDGSRE
jgi:UDP-3-O-[3-hydroxymyristoyl] glucosamine N-acyltransferase